MTEKTHLYLAKIPKKFHLESCNVDDQQAGWGRCFSEKRFREYTASRTLLSQVLEPGWSTREYRNKPPTLHNSDESQTRALSISHSNNWVAVAIAPVGDGIYLGVDIEPVRSNWTQEKAAFFCNPEQCKKGLALAGTEQDAFFTRLWTQKEAYFKATQQAFVGKGFDNDKRMRSEEFTENFLLSVYSEPALGLVIKEMKLTSG